MTCPSRLDNLFSFKPQWADLAFGTVPPGPIVVNFIILEDGPSHGFPGVEAFAVDQFYFHGIEKAFGHRIVIWVAFGAHGANQFMFFYQGLVFF